MQPLFAEDTQTEAHNRRLRILLKMSDESIAANEQGSTSQRHEMLTTLKSNIIVIAICALLPGYFVFRLSDHIEPPLWFIFLFVCLLLIVGTYLSLQGFKNVINGRVDVYEGVLRRVAIKNPFAENGHEIHYVVGKTRIHIPHTLNGVLKFGLPYRLYCAAGTQTIIGARVLTELPADPNGA